MKKKLGFLMIDMIVSLSLYTFVVLNLALLLSKNMRFTTKLYKNQEIRRLENNLKNIIRLDTNLEAKQIISYKIIELDNRLYLENLINGKSESLGKFFYINDEIIKNIKLKKEDLIFQNKKIGDILVLTYLLEKENNLIFISN